MRKTVFIVLALILWPDACRPLGAEPILSEMVQRYHIVGETAQDLRQEMNQKGPKGKAGEDFDAYTNWRVNWRYRWWESPDNCRITSVTTSVHVAFMLPAWQNYERADRSLKQKWDRYYKALYDHEKGHRDIGIEAAREIEGKLSNMASRKSCADLEKEAEAAAQEILRRHMQREVRYDIWTVHGARTGARFP